MMAHQKAKLATSRDQSSRQNSVVEVGKSKKHDQHAAAEGRWNAPFDDEEVSMVEAKSDAETPSFRNERAWRQN